MASYVQSGEMVSWEVGSEPKGTTDAGDTTPPRNPGLGSQPSSACNFTAPATKSEESTEADPVPDITQRVNLRRSQLKLPEKRRSVVRSRDLSQLAAGEGAIAVVQSSSSPGMRKKHMKDMVLKYTGMQWGFSGIKTPAMISIGSRTHGTCRDSRIEPIDLGMVGEEPGGNSNGTMALDPLEHEWMLAVASGNSEVIAEFLSLEPTLMFKKDFVTGLTVLHWLAKHGNHEALIQLLKSAEMRGLPANVNVKASGGHTPLHLAAMQGHHMVIKVLVGAFNADVTARDNSGLRAWQYLPAEAPDELRELIGAMDEETSLGFLNKNNNNASRGCSKYAPPPGFPCAAGAADNNPPFDQVDSAAAKSAHQSWAASFRSKLRKPFQFLKKFSDSLFDS